MSVVDKSIETESQLWFLETESGRMGEWLLTGIGFLFEVMEIF